MQNSVQQVIMYPQPALSTGNFWMAGCWRWWKNPDCLTSARKQRGPGASFAGIFSCVLSSTSDSFPGLSISLFLVHQHLLFSAWSLSILLEEGNTESCLPSSLVWRWLCVCVNRRSWADSPFHGQVLLRINNGESRASRLSDVHGLLLLCCLLFW